MITFTKLQNGAFENEFVAILTRFFVTFRYFYEAFFSDKFMILKVSTFQLIQKLLLD
jgi:hypothetical protein